MYSLAHESVTAWIQQSNWWVPQSVDGVCPHCGRSVNFNCGTWEHQPKYNAALASSTCSGCRMAVGFFALGLTRYGDTKSRECNELCMHPTPSLHRKSMEGLAAIPGDIARGYLSAINVYNAQEWGAAAMLVGRVLEGLVKEFMPEEKKDLTLARMLQELPQEVRLTDTLEKLIDSLRKGRNLGAHFEVGKEVDQEITSMMMDFLEYFLEYLYILPARVETLHNRL